VCALEHPLLIPALADHLRPEAVLLLIVEPLILLCLVMAFPTQAAETHHRLLTKHLALLMRRTKVLVTEELSLLLW